MSSKLIIHHGNKTNTPVVTGCPFPVEASSAGDFRVVGDKQDGLVQAYPLTAPTSGGLRWWELSFLSRWEGEVAIMADNDAESGPVLAIEKDGGVGLSNQQIKVDLPGQCAKPPVLITWQGGSGCLIPEINTLELGWCREDPASVRELKILRNGHIRAQVELTGKLTGRAGHLDYRLTLEVWRGNPALRVDWMITHACPDRRELTFTQASLFGHWQVGEKTERLFRQKAHGLGWQPRDVINPDPVCLIADHTMFGVHVADPDMLLDLTEYPFYCSPPAIATRDWLELRGDSGRVSATLVDFAHTQPNALESYRQELCWHFIPPNHRLTWSQGWRREQTMLLAFAPADNPMSPAELSKQAKTVFTPGRAQPAPETLRELGCFELDRILAHIPGKHLRVSGLLNQLCCLNSRATKFDLGDTPDWHYTRGYATGPHGYLPAPGFASFPRATSQNGYVFPDAFKFFVEPVWTNNEYDFIHAIATEVMRTGKNDHFPMLRWAARHNVEIDFLSYSDDPWHHRASPFHSHFHNRKGAITSHFWTQGLLQYYCLTGDRDALETARALGDKIITVNHNEIVRRWKFDREIGWALLALCCLAEAGETGYLDEAGRIASYLREYDRAAFTGAVTLSMGKAGRSLERQMIDNGFGYSSMVEALDRYHKLTEDKDFEAWFKKLLTDLKAAFWEKIEEGEAVSIRSMVGLVMTIGFERLEDADFLLAGQLILERWLDTTHANPIDISMAAGTEAGEAKPCAMAYRGLHRLLGSLDRQGELDFYEYSSLRRHRERGKT